MDRSSSRVQIAPGLITNGKAFFLSSLAATVGTGLFAFMMASSIQGLRAQVAIPGPSDIAQDLTWWTRIHMRTEHVALTPIPQLEAKFEAATPTDSVLPAKPSKFTLKASKPQTPQHPTPKSTVAVAKKSKAKKKVLDSQFDEALVSTQATAAGVPAAIAEAPVEPTIIETEATAGDMQMMHGWLTARFDAAMNIQPALPSADEVKVAAATTQPAPDAPKAAAIVVEPETQARRAVRAAVERRNALIALHKAKARAAALALQKKESQAASDEATAQAEIVQADLPVTSSPVAMTTQNKPAASALTTQPSVAVDAAKPADSNSNEIEAHGEMEDPLVRTSRLLATIGGTKAITPNLPITVSQAAATSPQKMVPPAPPMPTPDGDDDMGLMATQPSACLASQSDRVIRSNDAFNGLDILNTQSESVTCDSAAGARWVLTTAQSKGTYWKTLSWRKNGGSTAGVPMLSQISTLMLGKLLGTRVQTSAGIVFGRVPAGWSVRLSGRSENALFLDDSQAQIPADQTDRDRTFVFINVSPGAHILFVVKAKGGDQAAVALPVLEGGVATHVEVAQPEEVRMTGEIFDAYARNAHKIPGVKVRVVGQNVRGATDAFGRYSIDKVQVVPGHPIYIETDSDTSYTHRYRVVRPTDMSTLFQFPAKAVDRWLGQLDGGVSPEGGIVIGALPDLTSNNDKGTLFVGTHPVGTAATLVPETYTIGTEEKLQAGQALEDRGRFVGVQLPEGLNLVEAQNKSRRAMWSQLVFTSRHVINVLESR